jgi:hypothetical protein
VATSTDTITIPTWANGPDDSGNGGWSAGLLAARVADAPTGVAVSLRVPPPIGRPLRIDRADDGELLLIDDQHGDAGATPVVVARARPVELTLDVPDVVRSVSVDAAAAASSGFAFRARHPFPRCVACGISRDPELPSLGLHCGPVEGVFVVDDAGDPARVFADAWTPSPDLADPDRPEVISSPACWSALDCPSAAPMADPDAERPSVLAAISVRIDRRPRVGEPHVLAAWRRAVDGRKQWSTSVMLDARGELLGVADALWIEVRRP